MIQNAQFIIYSNNKTRLRFNYDYRDDLIILLMIVYECFCVCGYINEDCGYIKEDCGYIKEDCGYINEDI